LNMKFEIGNRWYVLILMVAVGLQICIRILDLFLFENLILDVLILIMVFAIWYSWQIVHSNFFILVKLFFGIMCFIGLLGIVSSLVIILIDGSMENASISSIISHFIHFTVGAFLFSYLEESIFLVEVSTD